MADNNEAMLKAIEAIEAAHSKLSTEVGSLPETKIIQSHITYALHGVDISFDIERRGRKLNVGAAYRHDGCNNVAYWVSRDCAEDEPDTIWTQKDTIIEWEQLILNWS